MIAKVWRERAIYAAMSAFVAWHSFVMIMAPAPETSEGLEPLLALLHPYVTLLQLDNEWDFFAPNINTGARLRYVLETEDGTTRTFTPLDEYNWYFPYFMWNSEWQDAILESPDVNARIAAALFCQQHAALKPVAVTLVEVTQKDFTPQDYLDGKRPFDPEFVTENTIKRFSCPPK